MTASTVTGVYATYKPGSGIVNVYESTGRRIGSINNIPKDVDNVSSSGTAVYVNRGHSTTVYECASGIPKMVNTFYH